MHQPLEVPMKRDDHFNKFMEINNEILALWKMNYSYDEDILVPLLYGKKHLNSLLFIGVNPSFSETGIDNLLSKSSLPQNSARELFKWRNLSDEDIESILQYEELAKAEYSYFKKFDELSKVVGHKWEHIDLFYFRQTSQNDFKKRILEKGKLNGFAKDQIRITHKIIMNLNPIAIVVSNAFASRIFTEEFNAFQTEDAGYFYIKNGSKNIPVFCSSMLTGQRALDTYSYSRLKWQIDLIVNKKTNDL